MNPTPEEVIEKQHRILMAVLDHIDYSNGMCSEMEMLAVAVPKPLLKEIEGVISFTNQWRRSKDEEAESS